MKKEPWFRFYAEFATDPKVQTMDEALQRRLVMLFCLKKSGDLEALSEEELAFTLRISHSELLKAKEMFCRKGFIDENWNILNWDKRQYQSDGSTPRVQRHRSMKRGETGEEHFSNGCETLLKRYGNGSGEVMEQSSPVSETSPDNREQIQKTTTPLAPLFRRGVSSFLQMSVPPPKAAARGISSRNWRP